MERFEVVKGYEDKEINIPRRSTAYSAGYDLEAAEDIIIPSFFALYGQICGQVVIDNNITIPKDFSENESIEMYTLDKMSELTKRIKTRPTLIPTGLKCKLDPNHYLKLVSRSSLPLKNWLICANSEGIIDAKLN